MVCGWCKAKNLQRIRDTGDGKVLEPHKTPGANRKCDGPATSGYSSGGTKRLITAK